MIEKGRLRLRTLSAAHCPLFTVHSLSSFFRRQTIEPGFDQGRLIGVAVDLPIGLEAALEPFRRGFRAGRPTVEGGFEELPQIGVSRFRRAGLRAEQQPVEVGGELDDLMKSLPARWRFLAGGLDELSHCGSEGDVIEGPFRQPLVERAAEGPQIRIGKLSRALEASAAVMRQSPSFGRILG